MSEENESVVRKLLFGTGQSESKEKVLQYIAHRLREGAHLRDVVQEEYVQRNCTQEEIDEILTDPRLVRKDREGLEEYFDSEEMVPTPPSTEER